MLRIFLAHAQEDEAVVSNLYKLLKKKGYKPWLDKEDLLAGQRWQTEIPKAIQNSQVFIACLSQNSVEKHGYVQREFRMALNICANKPDDSIYLIPVRIEDCEIPDLRQEECGINLRDYQWVDLFADDGFERLLSALEQVASDSYPLSTSKSSPSATPLPISPPQSSSHLPAPRSSKSMGRPIFPVTNVDRQNIPSPPVKDSTFKNKQHYERKTYSRRSSPSKEAFPPAPPAPILNVTQKSVQPSFPYVSISLFFLGIIPTGFYLWEVGHLSASLLGGVVFAISGMLSVSLGGVISIGSFARVGNASGGWAFVSIIALGSLAGQALVPEQTGWIVGLIQVTGWAGTWAIAMFSSLSGAFASASAAALNSSRSCSGTMASLLTLGFSLALAVIGAGGGVAAISSSETIGNTLVATSIGAVAGVIGAFSVGASVDARSSYSDRKNKLKWLGFAGGSMTLTGITSGLFTTTANNAEVSFIILLISFSQVFVIAKNTSYIEFSLSEIFQSKNKSLTVLNMICCLGILCGAILGWLLRYELAT